MNIKSSYFESQSYCGCDRNSDLLVPKIIIAIAAIMLIVFGSLALAGHSQEEIFGWKPLVSLGVIAEGITNLTLGILLGATLVAYQVSPHARTCISRVHCCKC